jgi:hypothetical protein
MRNDSIETFTIEFHIKCTLFSKLSMLQWL